MMRSVGSALIACALLASYTEAGACTADGSDLDACDSLTADVTCGAACKTGAWTNSVLTKTDGFNILFSDTSVATDVTFSTLTSTGRHADKIMVRQGADQDMGDIQFDKWPGTKLSFPALKFAGKVLLTRGSAGVVRFDFPELRTATVFGVKESGSFVCPLLESVAAPKLTTVAGASGEANIILGSTDPAGGFPKLTSVSFPSLVDSYELEIRYTAAVKSVSVPKLQMLSYFYVTYNDALETIDAPMFIQAVEWFDFYWNPKFARFNAPNWQVSGYAGDIYYNGGMVEGGTTWTTAASSNSEAATAGATAMADLSGNVESSLGLDAVNFVLLLVLGALGIVQFLNSRGKASVGASA